MFLIQTTPRTLWAAGILALAAAPALAQGADHCIDAPSISGLGPHAFDTRVATPTVGGLNTCGTTSDRSDVWFRWSAGQDARVALDLSAQTNFDVSVNVFRDNGCTGPFRQILCTSNVSSSFAKSFFASAGESYLIRVGSLYIGETGTGTFTVIESLAVLNPNNGSYYEVVPEARSWSSARNRARTLVWGNKTGNLASLTTQAERDWVELNLPMGNTWTGAYQDLTRPDYAEPSGGWVWDDGTAAALPWAAGEPNDPGSDENYALRVAGGLFRDVQLQSASADSFLVEWLPQLGTIYCEGNPNVTGQIGGMSLDGSAIRLDSDLTLIASSLPVGSFGYFIVCDEPGFFPNPAGSAGDLCLDGQIGRYNGPGQVQAVSPSGTITLDTTPGWIPTPGGIYGTDSGDMLHFQCWYRDVAGGMGTSNFTEGIRVRVY